MPTAERRPTILDATSPALRVKIRDEATVRSLGLWIEHTEGAKFWMNVFSDLKTRGCR